MLDISPDLRLPLDAVTEPIGILAVRRAGKSNLAVRMAEQMHKYGLHWVAIDPKGDWYGIRSAADGKGKGLPIPIFGGRHGDLPLEPGAGATIADLIVDQRITCVLDVSGFASEAEKIRFLLAFSTRLFHRKNETQDPTHVFFEEADDYIPQKPFAEQARLVHAMARILKQGGSRGLGGTIISQRSAVVNKDVLTQVQTLFALRTTSPQDRKAIQGWVSFTGENAKVIETLPKLGDGEAWVWSPNWLKVTKRIQCKRRETFDSGSTPKQGRSKTAPATLADIDLGAIKTLMADTLERAKAEDPKHLKARIAQLELALKKAQTVPKVTMPPGMPLLHNFVRDSKQRVNKGLEALQDLPGDIRELYTFLDGVLKRFPDATHVTHTTPLATVSFERSAGAPTSSSVATRRDTKPPREHAAEPGSSKLRTLGRRILTTLAQCADVHLAITRERLAILVGYHQNSKGLVNTLGALRSAGLLDNLTITDRGREELGEYELLPTGAALLEWYCVNKLTPAQATLLQTLAEQDEWDRLKLAERMGYHPNSKGFVNNLGRLRGMGLVEGLKVTELLRG